VVTFSFQTKETDTPLRGWAIIGATLGSPVVAVCASPQAEQRALAGGVGEMSMPSWSSYTRRVQLAQSGTRICRAGLVEVRDAAAWGDGANQAVEAQLRGPVPSSTTLLHAQLVTAEGGLWSWNSSSEARDPEVPRVL